MTSQFSMLDTFPTQRISRQCVTRCLFTRTPDCRCQWKGSSLEGPLQIPRHSAGQGPSSGQMFPCLAVRVLSHGQMSIGGAWLGITPVQSTTTQVILQNRVCYDCSFVPAGTAKMGPANDTEAVVNHELKVVSMSQLQVTGFAGVWNTKAASY